MTHVKPRCGAAERFNVVVVSGTRNCVILSLSKDPEQRTVGAHVEGRG